MDNCVLLLELDEDDVVCAVVGLARNVLRPRSGMESSRKGSEMAGLSHVADVMTGNDEKASARETPPMPTAIS